MANEATIINNPTSIPEAVSTGYQRQNVRAEAMSNGLDCSYVAPTDTDEVTLYTGGPVDYNGVLYALGSNVAFTIPAAGRYYIYLEGAESAATLTPTLDTDEGTYDATKNGRYTATGRRVLNWVISWDGSAQCEVVRLVSPESEYNNLIDVPVPVTTWITSNTTWTAPRSKFYEIWITGRGGNGGTGGTGGNTSAATVPTRGTAGGKAGSSGYKRLWIDAGDIWTATFSATNSSAAYAEFTDGVTTLRAGNLGGTVTGCDEDFPGGGEGKGGNGATSHTWIDGLGVVTPIASPGYPGDPGGASIYGAGGASGAGGAAGGAGSAGGAASAYGSGGGSGGGGSVHTTAGGSGGAGAQGAIRIIG